MTKIKSGVKLIFTNPTKNCAKLTTKLITAMYKSKVVKFKLDEDTIQHQVYFLSFMNSLKKIITIFRNTHVAYGLSIHKR